MSILESNLAKASACLERFRAEPLGHFIAGRRERGSSCDFLDNLSPVDGRVINQVVSGSIGPQIVTVDEVGEAPLRLMTRVNGEVRQSDSSDQMLFPIPYLISYLSQFCTLETGDLILTGIGSFSRGC